MKNQILGYLFIILFAIGCFFIMNAEGSESEQLENVIEVTWEKGITLIIEE